MTHAHHRRFRTTGRALAILTVGTALLAGSPAIAADPGQPETGGAAELREFALTRGHLDLFDVRYSASEQGLTLTVKDDSGLYGEGTQFRDPEAVTIVVDTALSALEIPDDMPDGFEFLGEPGTLVYHLPFTQDDALPWPGWSTERLLDSLPQGMSIPIVSDAVTLDLDVEGPGELFTWMEGSFGNVVNRYVDTTDSAPDIIPIARSAHVHTAWAFTEPGDYTITVTPTALTSAGHVTGSPVTYHFAVGPTPVPRSIEPPALIGVAEVGSVLTVDIGSWHPRPHTTDVQWMRDDVPIAGASGMSYAPVAADDGRSIAARVTARIEESAAEATTAALTVGEVPDGKPSHDDTEPVPGSSLTDANRGGVDVLTEVVERGSIVRVALGEREAGEWVSVWLPSGTRWLGWVLSDSAQQIAVRVPADTATGTQRLAVKDVNGELIGWDSVRVTAPSSPPPPEQPSVQAPPTQCSGGAAIISSGHVDYATVLVDGALQSLVGDDSSGAKVYREPDGVVLWLRPESRVVLPSGFERIGAAGSTVWQVPLTQNPNLIWLGWSTESLNAATVRGPVAWTLDSVDGPSAVTVYLSGTFGGVQEVVLDGAGSRYDIPLGVHAHAAWAFRAEGVYRLTMTQRATLASGSSSADTETLTIVVGDVDPAPVAAGGSGCGIVPASAIATTNQLGLLSAPQARASASLALEQGAVTALGGAQGDTPPGWSAIAVAPGSQVPFLLGILGAVLLAGAAGSTVLAVRSRR